MGAPRTASGLTAPAPLTEAQPRRAPAPLPRGAHLAPLSPPSGPAPPRTLGGMKRRPRRARYLPRGSSQRRSAQ